MLPPGEACTSIRWISSSGTFTRRSRHSRPPRNVAISSPLRASHVIRRQPSEAARTSRSANAPIKVAGTQMIETAAISRHQQSNRVIQFAGSLAIIAGITEAKTSTTKPTIATARTSCTAAARKRPLADQVQPAFDNIIVNPKNHGAGLSGPVNG